MGHDILRVEANERIDLADFQFLVDDALQANIRQIHTAFVTNSGAPMSVLDGFAMSNPAGAQLQVDRGRAIVGQREGTSTFFGAVIAKGDANKIIDLSSFADNTYDIFIRFEYNDGSNANRVFWNPSGNGSEFSKSISTRRLANWNIAVEVGSPGAEWLKIGEVTVSSGSITLITDTREFFFEGPVASTYQSGWSTDGGGGASDRDADRAANGITDLHTFNKAMRQCVEDIKGRGLRRWWDPGIGGLNVGFDTDPTEDTVNVGDVNFGLFYEDANTVHLKVDSLETRLTYDRTTSVWKFDENGASSVFTIDVSGDPIALSAGEDKGLTISAGADTGAGGNLLTLSAGAGIGGFNGGTATLAAGDAGASGSAGGLATIQAGDATNSGSVGGDAELLAGSGEAAGGEAKIRGGSVTGINADGGPVSIVSANGLGTGQGGNMTITSGSSVSGNAGSLSITSGTASTAGLGGGISFTVGASAAAAGSDMTLTAGAAGGANQGGFLRLVPGTGTPDGFISGEGTMMVGAGAGTGFTLLGAGVHVRSSSSGASSVSASADDVVIESSGDTGLTILSGTNNSGSLYFGDSANNSVGEIEFLHGLDLLRMRVVSAEIGMNASGNVMMGPGTDIEGVTPLGQALHVVDSSVPGGSVTGSARLVVENNGNCSIEIISNGSNNGVLSFNDTVADQAFIQYNHPTDRMRIGTNGAEALRISSSGNLALGITSDPNEKLDVVQARSGDFMARFRNSNGNDGDQGIRIQAGSNSPAAATTFIEAQQPGGAPTGRIETDAAGVFQLVDVSDAELKTDIAPSSQDQALSILRGLEVVDFRFKSAGQLSRFGFTAQNCQDVFPDMVSEIEWCEEDDTGLLKKDERGNPIRHTHLGTKRAALIPILVMGWKQQQDRIAALEAKIAALGAGK